jgi:glycerol-3-phosphate acyltransferase PlsY
MMPLILWVAAAWILGGLPSGLWLARLKGAPDPTSTGSGSSGATNVGRLLGWRWGLVVLLLDVGKGMAAAALPLAAGGSPALAALCAVAAVVGHCASPLAGFRGGKGVATSAGAALVLGTQAAVVAFLAMVTVLLLSRRMAPASLTGMWIFGALAVIFPAWQRAPWWFGLVMAVVVTLTHRQNLDRLRRGVEPTLWGAPAGDPRWRHSHEEPLVK